MLESLHSCTELDNSANQTNHPDNVQFTTNSAAISESKVKRMTGMTDPNRCGEVARNVEAHRHRTHETTQLCNELHIPWQICGVRLSMATDTMGDGTFNVLLSRYHVNPLPFASVSTNLIPFLVFACGVGQPCRMFGRRDHVKDDTEPGAIRSYLLWYIFVYKTSPVV